MKRLLLTLCGAAACWGAAAQDYPLPDDWREAESESKSQPRFRADEIGLRYEAQVGVGGGGRLDMQYLGLDYAHYFPRNIGFRTGLNWYVEGCGAGEFGSIPVQFSWRSGRLAPAGYASSDRGYYYDGRYYRDEHYGVGSRFADLLLSVLPTAFEVHAGVTPGMLLGGRTQDSDDSFSVDRRFACTADAGGRFIIPVWRFDVYCDITYHYFLTRNFYNRAWNRRSRRSFVGIGAGVSFEF